VSVYCEDCKYLKLRYIGLVPHIMCIYKENIWNGGCRAVLDYTDINTDGKCDWYKPSLKKRLTDLILSIKKRLLYYLERARNFRP